MSAWRSKVLATAALGTLLTLQSVTLGAQTVDAPVSAIWRTHTIEFRFNSERQKFRCEELAARITSILRSVGTRLTAQSELRCGDTFSSAVRGRLVVIAPIEATNDNVERALREITSEDRLVARVNGHADPSTRVRAFPAQWRAVSSATMKLDSGDCELLHAMERQLFPLLGLREVDVSGSCSSNRAPTFVAHALVRIDAPKPDQVLPHRDATTLQADCASKEDACGATEDIEALPAG